MKKIILLSLGALLASGNIIASVPFKNNSILAEGRWVKVRISRTGIYELTDEQLKSYGFHNPKQVKVFGQGGEAVTDNFVRPFTDDLTQVPAMRENGKLFFYGKGTTKESINIASFASFDIYTTLTVNPYDSDSYYFLTDRTDISPLEIERCPTSADAIKAMEYWMETGYEFWTHERDIVNLARSGKQFLGEDYSQTGEITFDVPVPMLADGKIQIYTTTGIKTSFDCTADITVNDSKASMIGNNTLRNNSRDASQVFSNLNLRADLPTSDITTSNGNISVKLKVTPKGINIGRIDYMTVGFPAYNALPNDSSQTRRYYKTNGPTGIRLTKQTPTTHAWLVDNSYAPDHSNFTTVDYILSDDSKFIVTPEQNGWAEIVYFDSDRQQLQPSYAGEVGNQNLHAMSSPDMVIITTTQLMQEAERLAEYHRSVDKMEVAVLDHNLIFNEFSSGHRDAMAYRRFAKMLYQRNTPAKKFRYLLLFGGGTYDNRQIIGEKQNDILLTYQSPESTNDVNSYSTDDFFGIFSETAELNSQLDASQMQIAVGRIQYNSPAEMHTYIDKLLSYMSNQDKCRSNSESKLLLIGESGDNYIHANQCESFVSEFEKAGNFLPEWSKIYMEAYANDADARKKFVEQLKLGQNFVLFIGHSNIANMTKSMVMLDIQKAIDTKYENPPIMFFSSCDVGRFDIGQTSFIDKLMNNPQGGIIAAIASTRQAYTNLNGRLTNSFAKYLGMTSDHFDGEKTLGKILLYAKNYCTKTTKNRRKYHLLGDPAMRVEMPLPKIQVSTINGMSTDKDITVGPYNKVSIEGLVANADGNTDKSFNGSIEISLTDSKKLHLNAVYQNKPVKYYSEGSALATTATIVENGCFKAEIIIPASLSDDGEPKPLLLFAKSDDGRLGYSGRCDALKFDRTATTPVNDATAPTIDAMYIDNKATFQDGMHVGTDFTIYAEVTDNVALNLSNESLTTSAYISLDGGQETAIVKPTPLTSSSAILSAPLYSLTPGIHSAQLMVADNSGNATSRTISFFVETGENLQATMAENAVNDVATIDVVANTPRVDKADIRITDDKGNLLFSTANTSLPFRWNGKDNNAIRLPEGVYNLEVIVGGIGAPKKKIVVTKQ